jgi:hypothetical protein
MLIFPQLVTGASALYPLKKTSIQRTVVNTLDSGATVVFADPDGAAMAWELHAAGLTGAEANAIETLFQATSGMWQTFTFLDPTANLLLQSEDLSATAWTNGALIQLTAGIDDPLGTARATRVINAGGAPEAVAQALPVPGNFQYCLSTWARSIAGSTITLEQSTAGGSVTKTFSLTGEWTRIVLSGNCGLSAPVSVTFAARLEAGGSMDLFGMQLEAQLGASDYKQTGASGGVHGKARFAEDSITVTAQGTDVYDAVVKIVDTEG